MENEDSKVWYKKAIPKASTENDKAKFSEKRLYIEIRRRRMEQTNQT